MGGADRDHVITWAAAQDLIGRHRAIPGVSRAIEGAFGGSFKKADVMKVLEQANCTHLRFYYGRNPNGTPALVLLGGVGPDGDMSDGVVLDTHYPCPPYCPSV